VPVRKRKKWTINPIMKKGGGTRLSGLEWRAKLSCFEGTGCKRSKKKCVILVRDSQEERKRVRLFNGRVITKGGGEKKRRENYLARSRKKGRTFGG